MVFQQAVSATRTAGNDHMVDKRDIHHGPDLVDPFCESHILHAGTQVSAWMAVHQHDSGRVGQNGTLKNVLGRRNRRLNVSDADNIEIDRSVFYIQVHDTYIFPVHLGEDIRHNLGGTHMTGDFFRAVDGACLRQAQPPLNLF